MSSVLLVPFPVAIMAGTGTCAFASYFIKRSSGHDSLLALLKNRYLYLGVIFYIAAALFNVAALAKADYSVVLPMTSLAYIWTLLLARFLLGERITPRKIFAIALILFGVILLALQ
jgi:drug/metabolite transporter (DMT)-like permease